MNRLLATLSLAALTTAAIAQSQPPAPTDNPPPAAQPTPGVPNKDAEQDRASLKARLERSIPETEQRLSRMKDALARLNKGESTEAVMGAMDNGHHGGPDGRQRRPGPGWDPSHRDGPPQPDANADKPDREVVLSFLAEHNPEFAERLKSSLKDNPTSAERTIGRIAPGIREALAERDPETRDLRIADMRTSWDTMSAIHKLTDALRKGDNTPEVQEATARVRDLAGVQFDTQVKLRNREIAVLEDRVARIRKELGDSLSQRDTFVSRQLDRALKWAHDRASQPPHKDGLKGDKPPPGAPATQAAPAHDPT